MASGLRTGALVFVCFGLLALVRLVFWLIDGDSESVLGATALVCAVSFSLAGALTAGANVADRRR